MNILNDRLRRALQELRDRKTYKTLRHLTKPMGPTTHIEGIGEVLVHGIAIAPGRVGTTVIVAKPSAPTKPEGSSLDNGWAVLTPHL